MSDVTTLVSRLKTEASIQDSERFDTGTLQRWIVEAIRRHSPSYLDSVDPNNSSIPDDQDYPVIILAWIDVCFGRASKFINQDNKQTNSMTIDPDSPYKKNMNMASMLRTRYDDIVSQISGDGDGVTVVQSKLSRKSYLTDLAVGGKSVTPTIRLSSSNVTNMTVDLLWVMPYFDDYADAYLYTSDEQNTIKVPQNIVSDDGTPGISDSSTNLATIVDQTQTTLRVTDMVPNTTSRFLLVVKRRSGQWVYSNEITVVNPT